MRTLNSILCVILLFTIAAIPVEGKTKKKSSKASTSQVIFTGDIAKKVYGYNGKTPVNIHVKDGKIAQIEVLPNEETPQYLKRAVAKVCPQYEGKTISEALKVKADVATGATYTSEALIKNIQMGLEQSSQPGSKGKSGSKHK
ncbi:MAG: FMN-binding protein [Muribaculaceae bacterium]|nr:FMN-binding protein [Muribaculaceae bacterium]